MEDEEKEVEEDDEENRGLRCEKTAREGESLLLGVGDVGRLLIQSN